MYQVSVNNNCICKTYSFGWRCGGIIFTCVVVLYPNCRSTPVQAPPEILTVVSHLGSILWRSGSDSWWWITNMEILTLNKEMLMRHVWVKILHCKQK